MRTIDPTGRFRKDVRRELKGQYRQVVTGELDDLIALLAADIILDARYRDHGLSGEWKGCRDCRIRPDLVLIYRKIGDTILQLLRIGSHAELGW